MTLEQLGSLGEFVSSIAVVLSLIYVAMQLKQNTRELKRTAFRDIYQSYSNVRRSVYTDTGIASLLVGAQSSPSDLSAVDRLKLENYYNEQLFCTVQLMNAASEGQVEYSDEAWDATILAVVEELDSQLFRSYISKFKSIYPEHFLAQIEEVLEGVST